MDSIKKYLDKIRGDKTLVNGVFFSIFSFVGRGISFIILIILASYIPPSDYGKLSLFNTAVMLLGFFMAFSTNGYLGISFFREDKKTFHKDFSYVILLLLITSCLISLLLLFIGDYLSRLVGISYDLLWYALLIAFVNVPFSIHMDLYRLQENIKMYGVMNLGNAILNAVISLVLVISFAQGWMGRVNTHVGVSVFFGVIAFIFFVKKNFFDFRLYKDRMKMILLWGLPQIPHLMTNWIRQGCDQYIINYNYTTQEVGLFSFALNLVGIITMIGVAFNSSNSVTIYQVLSDKNEKNKKTILEKNTRNIFIVYLGTSIVTVLFGCFFVPIFLPKYVESIPYFAMLSVYGFMVCMYFLFCNYLFYYGHTKNLMYITFGTSLLHLLLSLLLTHYSLYFTVLVYIVSQTICSGIVFFYSRRILKQEISVNYV